MTKESGRGGVRRGCLVGKWNKRMKCGYTPSVWLVFPASYFHLLPPSASFWCGKTVLPLLSRDFPLACCCSSRHSHPGRFSTLRGNVWWDCVMIMNPIWIPPDELTETQWKWRKMCCRANKAQFQIHRQRFNKVSIVTCFLPRPESFAFSHLSSPAFFLVCSLSVAASDENEKFLSNHELWFVCV